MYFNQTATNSDGESILAYDYLSSLLGIIASCNVRKGYHLDTAFTYEHIKWSELQRVTWSRVKQYTWGNIVESVEGTLEKGLSSEF